MTTVKNMLWAANAHVSGQHIKIDGSRAKVKIPSTFLCVVAVVIETNGVRSDGAIITMEGSKEEGERMGEMVLVCPASPEPSLRRCLIRPVNR